MIRRGFKKKCNSLSSHNGEACTRPDGTTPWLETLQWSRYCTRYCVRAYNYINTIEDYVLYIYIVNYNYIYIYLL